jgi:hypothetical protein
MLRKEKPSTYWVIYMIAGLEVIVNDFRAKKTDNMAKNKVIIR